MKQGSRYFRWREDAIALIRKNGFQYEENYGWTHKGKGLNAIIEFSSRRQRPWALTVYALVQPK